MSSFSGTAIRATASAVVSASRCVASSLLNGHADAGQTAKLHNCTTTGAATNGNCVFTIPLDTPQAWFFDDVAFDTGLVVILSGGTPDVTVTLS